MTGKTRAIRTFVLINLAAWVLALIPAEGVRDWTSLAVWSALWLAIVVPFSLGVALTDDRYREQWAVLRNKQSIFINRHLTNWTGRNRGPGRDAPDIETDRAED